MGTSQELIQSMLPADGNILSGEADVEVEEELRARELACRYRCEYLDLHDFRLDATLLRNVEVGLMFRYNFVPLEEKDGVLVIAIPDPSQLMMIDEIGLLLRRQIEIKVATLSQISDILKKSEQSQRVLEEASEAFAFDVIRESGNGDEQIPMDRLSAESDVSPMIKLVERAISTLKQAATPCR